MTRILPRLSMDTANGSKTLSVANNQILNNSPSHMQNHTKGSHPYTRPGTQNQPYTPPTLISKLQQKNQQNGFFGNFFKTA